MGKLLFLNALIMFVLALCWTSKTWLNIFIKGGLILAFGWNLFALFTALGFIVRIG